jgi:hypothetical protein
MRWLFALLLLAASVARAADWELPSANQGWWLPETIEGTPGTGIPGGLEQYLAGGENDRAETGTVVNVVTAHSADNTGATSVNTAVAAAISAVSSGGVIYFPAGTYKFTAGGINIPSGKPNVTIRGAGVGTTRFVMSAADVAIFVWPDPGYIAQAIQTVSGTKVKGTASLTVSDTSEYTAGQIVWVDYENEVDETRIEAGAAPVWSSKGFPFSRVMTARLTSKTSGSLTIDPPIPADATNLQLRAYHYGLPNTKVVGWGFEDFSVSFDNAAHPMEAFNINAAQYNWFYNVHFEDYSRIQTNYNGSCIKIINSYRCEIRKNIFEAASGNNGSDGAIQTGSNTSCIFADNIFKGEFDTHIYDSGNSNNNVIAYNFSDQGIFTNFHNTHPSLNLIEGNIAYTHQSDGYHGSSSHNTIYRNWMRDQFSVILNRFKRNYVIAGNHLGDDGTVSPFISWGNPNMGNGDARGFAGPTGLSDQVGELDYQQNDGTPNTYTIQAGDVFAGDFWQDWEATGTLTTRISDTKGVFAVDGGHWYTGSSNTSDSTIGAVAWWSNKSGQIGAYNPIGSVTAVSGSDVTMEWPSGSLPPEETVVQLYMFNGGWQERDLDVKASSTLVENYWSAASGTGSIQDGTADTLPSALSYAAKPAWFGSLSWPPFDPNDASTQSNVRIPSGYRYTNGNEDYLGGVSTPQYSPAPGTYASAQTVTITSGTPSATIYYTIDGTTPTTSSTLYSAPVTLPGTTTTLKALAVKSGLDDSSIQSGTYTISGGGGGGAATIQTLNVGTLNIQ